MPTRLLRVEILDGHDSFASVHRLTVYGELIESGVSVKMI